MALTIPSPITRAFEDRVTLNITETARLLAMDIKTLREHVRAGNIGYVSKGLGNQKLRREFTLNDVVEFIERMRHRECPSTSPKSRRITNTISNGKVIGFTARLAKKTAEKQKPLKDQFVRG